MHLRSLEIFCDVVLHRSFSKAASMHDISQPTASQAVQGIEERLGVELIDRTQRPLGLTAAGEVYYEGVRKLLHGFRSVEDQVQQIRDKVNGQVNVAAIYSIGLLQMDSLIRKFNERYPAVKVRIEYLHPDQVLSQVLQDEADLGLLSFPKETRELTAMPWQDQPLVLVTAGTHPLSRLPDVSVQALHGIDLISFTTDLVIRKQLDRWLRQAKVSPHVVLEFDNIENIKQAVEIGSGAAILPAPAVRREVAAGNLFAIPFTDVSWTRPLGIIHRRQKQLPNAVQKFIELLRQDVTAPPSAGPAETAERDPAATTSDWSKRLAELM